jgi:hypothetical protein
MSAIEQKAQELSRAYALTFGSPSGQIVLADLDLYCFGLESVAVPGNGDRTFMNEGRREVLLRIQKFTNVNLKELFELRMGRPVLRNEDGEKIGE